MSLFARRFLGGALGVALVCGALGCESDIQSGIDRATDMMYRKRYVDSSRLYRNLLSRLENDGELDAEQRRQRLLILDRLGKLQALYLRNYPQAIRYYKKLVRD